MCLKTSRDQSPVLAATADTQRAACSARNTIFMEVPLPRNLAASLERIREPADFSFRCVCPSHKSAPLRERDKREVGVRLVVVAGRRRRSRMHGHPLRTEPQARNAGESTGLP